MILCEACRRRAACHRHHIKSRGSGGDDTSDNLMFLCAEDHHLVHQEGPVRFVEKYPHLRAKVTRQKPAVSVLLAKGPFFYANGK